MIHTTQNNLVFSDCVDNINTPRTAKSISPGYECLNDSAIAEGILFSDIAVIEARINQKYLTATIANANCDCGR